MCHARHSCILRWAGMGTIVCTVCIMALRAGANLNPPVRDLIIKVFSDGGLPAANIIVHGDVQAEELWLGCTFRPGTANAQDILIDGENKHSLVTGDFTRSIAIRGGMVEPAHGEKTAQFAVTLWRKKIDRHECRRGGDSNACQACMRNGYHVEEPICTGRGTWSVVEGKVTAWGDIVQDAQFRPRAILVYYYDLGSGQLFSASRESVPPIDAPSGKYGVRAHVFTCGDCGDESRRFIGWLEMYTPNAKTAMVHLPAGSTPDEQTASLIKDGHLIAGPDGTKWVQTTSPNGTRLREAVKSKCGDIPPVPCRPKR